MSPIKELRRLVAAILADRPLTRRELHLLCHIASTELPDKKRQRKAGGQA